MSENRITLPGADSNGHASLLENPTVAAAVGTGVPPVPEATENASAVRQPGAAERPATGAARTGETPVPTGESGREASGRFAKGNPGGPGNPFARQVGQLRQVLLKVLTPERMDRIANRFCEMAEQGNLQAGRLVFAYALGKPTPMPDPDRLDFEEWQGYKESANWMLDVPALITRPSREMPLTAVRAAQPAVMRQEARELGAILGMDAKNTAIAERHMSDPVNGPQKLRDHVDRYQTAKQKKARKQRH